MARHAFTSAAVTAAQLICFSFISRPLSRSVSFSPSPRFSGSTALCFLSLSFSLLFSVFPLIHQLLTTFLSPSRRISICTFPVCHSISSPFLLPICPPFLCLSHSVSVRSERSFPALRGVRGDKQFSVLLFTFSSDWAKCVRASICVCVYSVQKRERQCYLAGIGPGCCVTTH